MLIWSDISLHIIIHSLRVLQTGVDREWYFTPYYYSLLASSPNRCWYGVIFHSILLFTPCEFSKPVLIWSDISLHIIIHSLRVLQTGVDREWYFTPYYYSLLASSPNRCWYGVIFHSILLFTPCEFSKPVLIGSDISLHIIIHSLRVLQTGVDMEWYFTPYYYSLLASSPNRCWYGVIFHSILLFTPCEFSKPVLIGSDISLKSE